MRICDICDNCKYQYQDQESKSAFLGTTYIDQVNEYNYYVECLEDVEIELSKTTDLEKIRGLGFALTDIRNRLKAMDNEFKENWAL